MSTLIGTISAMGFGGQHARVADWLFCDGRAVSRATYQALFAVIKTSWGSGDGTTTFNLPDLRGSFVRGVDDGTGRDPGGSARHAINPGGNTGDDVGTGQGCATALPSSRNLATAQAGAHLHAVQNLPNDSSYYNIAGSHYAAWNSGSTATSQAGAHTHSCGQGNANGNGGDAESRCVNVYVDYMIYAGAPARTEQRLATPPPVSPSVPKGDYPLGTILPFGGPVNETELQQQGWAYCNGNTVSRTTYADLFAAIGIAYGDGDGVSTFNLPDFRGLFQRGVSGATASDPDAKTRKAAAPGGNTGDEVGSAQGFASGPPVNSMVTNSAGTHTHDAFNIPDDSSSSAVAGSYQAIWNGGSENTDTQGDHIHSMVAGGDAETRPVNAACYFVIKFQQV